MVVAHHIIADQKRYVAPTGRRALKASNAVVLRDGVYLEPERESCRASFNGLAAEVSEGGGTAHVLRVKESEGDHFVGFFDRSHDVAALLSQMYGGSKVFKIMTSCSKQPQRYSMGC